jgi:hypothetical protein
MVQAITQSDWEAKRNRIGLLKTNRRAKMAERIYIVYGSQQGTRLVKASLRQQALSHVANGEFNIHVATQDDLVRELSEGTKIEQYRPPEQISHPLDGE